MAPVSIRCLGLILLTALSLSATAGAVTGAACTAPLSGAVVSVKKLPLQIQDFLERDSPGHSGIADAGEKYNVSDVIVDPAIPRSRFISANVGTDCANVTVERGGRGHSVQTITFKRGEQGWELATRKN